MFSPEILVLGLKNGNKGRFLKKQVHVLLIKSFLDELYLYLPILCKILFSIC